MKRIVNKFYLWLEGGVGHILTQSFSIFAGNIFGSLILAANFIIIARSLGLAQLGLLTLIISCVQLSSKLFNCQSWQGLIKFGVEYLESKQFASFFSLLRYLFYIELATAFLAFIASFIISFFISGFLKTSENIQIYVQIYAFSIFFNMDSIPMGILRIYKKFNAISIYQVSCAAIKLALILMAFKFSKILITIVWVFLASEIINGIILWALCLYVLNKRLPLFKYFFAKAEYTKGIFGRVTRFLFVTNITGSVKLLYKELDVFILKFFFPEMELGILKIAKQLGLCFSKTSDSINQVLYPAIVSLYNKNKIKGMLRIIAKITLLVSMLAAGVLFAFALFGEDFMRVLLKSEYARSAKVVFLFLLGDSLIMIFGWMPSLLLTAGKPKLTLITLSISSFIYLILMFNLVPKYGALGVAVSSLVLNASIFLIMSLFIRQTLLVSSFPKGKYAGMESPDA